MKQPFRNPEGGRINRTRLLRFSFDGTSYAGYAGDTLASALLANGIKLVGRSFKYHRPRGIIGIGPEEPNALVQLREGARIEPNVRATQTELYDGLVATSQNRWPSLHFDVGGFSNVLSRFFPAGFYYKTFMWPAGAWQYYERFIRRAAGLGKSPSEPDPDRYEKRYIHCDVLVVGGGPTGLASALAVGHTGARLIVVDENPEFGGTLRFEHTPINNMPALDWINASIAKLQTNPTTRLLNRATAFGYYDHNLVAVAERVADHVAEPAPYQPRVRIWLIRARQVVLAAGSIERPLVFAGNDCPGVMLASAARAYANHYAVRAGEEAVLFTNNDSAYAAALDLQEAGVKIVAMVDTRAGRVAAADRRRFRTAGIECLTGHAVIQTYGRRTLQGVDVMQFDGDKLSGLKRHLSCDLLCTSGGWNPTVHLFSQSQGKLHFDDSIAAFIPGESRQKERSAGAAKGTFDLRTCIAEGLEAGRDAAIACGFRASTIETPVCEELETTPLMALWVVPPPPRATGKQFVDLQNDVTADDIGLAVRENYISVEHLKRYTTLGMGTDQGRTSNTNGLAIMAKIRQTDIPSVGVTTFRPPYTPVTLGALAGRNIGKQFTSTRYTPMHKWHVKAGACLVPAGLWLRAQCYPAPSENVASASQREALAVRKSVGIIDISTLGKIDIRGRDISVFLERIYINRWKSLKVGRCRYGMMLREDGFVMDDGTTTRIDENHYYMTTTTANADSVLAHLEYHAQVVWPELHVHLTSVTDHWAAMAISGPNSRKVLEKVVEGTDVSNHSLPYMSHSEGKIAGAPIRLLRISFSGEMAYELHTPADYGQGVWETLLAAGESYDIVPYGTEAMGILRIEKGHVASPELDGRTTPGDLGFARILRPNDDFIGKRSLERPAMRDQQRKILVGLCSTDGETPIPRGGQLVKRPTNSPPVLMLGHVTSVAYSPNLKTPIALALLTGGTELWEQTLYAMSPLTGQTVPVQVVNPVFIDPKGERLHG